VELERSVTAVYILSRGLSEAALIGLTVETKMASPLAPVYTKLGHSRDTRVPTAIRGVDMEAAVVRVPHGVERIAQKIYAIFVRSQAVCCTIARQCGITKWTETACSW